MKDKEYSPETKNVLETLEKSSLDSWEKRQAVNDKLIWHYASQYSLVEIFRKGTIRVSNALYLNDSMEVNHAKDLIYNSVLTKLGSTTDADLLEFLEQIKVSMQISDLISQPLVGCFSGEVAEDLLSQWRAYGDNGQGYALGFEPNELPSPSSNTKLRKIVYDVAEQNKIVNDSIESYLKELQTILSTTSSGPQKNTFIRDFSHSLAKILHEYLCCFKHPSWEAEQEVRLVYSIVPFSTAKVMPNTDDLEFRQSQTGLLIPYKDIVVWKENPENGEKRLPLKKIIVGPKLDFRMAENSLKQILERYGYGRYPGDPYYVSIKQSELTLR